MKPIISLLVTTGISVALFVQPQAKVPVVTRKGMLSLVAIPAAATAAGALYPATQLLDELIQLRSDVRNGKLKSAKKVAAAKERTLEPLRNAMEKNPLNEGNAKAKLQPLLMKGHMLELEQALTSGDGFSTYVSKTTGETYPGGKVERELEEAVDTARDYCAVIDCDTLLIYR